jgi:Caspase domain
MYLAYNTMKRSVWAAILSVLFVAAAPSHADDKVSLPECHILSIGVENYPNAQQLPGCAADATFLANRFSEQQGKLFSKTDKTILTNSAASQAAIEREMNRISNIGKAGDWVVLVYSGHNSNKGTNWGFLSQDEKHVSGKKIANLADALAKQDKKVIVIMDNCFSGNLRLMSQDALLRHNSHSKGGIVLMVASVPTQTSITRMHQFSVFSKAIDEALSGQADYNGDGMVTLQEVRTYVYARVHHMLGSPNGVNSQDGEIAYSLSLNDSMVLARVRPAVLNESNSLTKTDVKDKVRIGSFCKVYTVQLQKGMTYTIDMKSKEVDSFLRLEDANGKELTFNDDGGEGRDARIVFTPGETGTYRIIATTYGAESTGAFTVVVK